MSLDRCCNRKTLFSGYINIIIKNANFQILNFLCPRDKRQGALCFAPVRLSVSPLKKFVYSTTPRVFKQLFLNFAHTLQAF